MILEKENEEDDGYHSEHSHGEKTSVKPEGVY